MLSRCLENGIFLIITDSVDGIYIHSLMSR
jgi:hypothetical protein